MSDSLQPYGLYLTKLLSPWDFPGKNTGVGCHAFCQEIFLTKGLNPHLLRLLHCRRTLYHCHWGSLVDLYTHPPNARSLYRDLKGFGQVFSPAGLNTLLS